MLARQLGLIVLSVAAIAVLVGCGGSTFDVQNPGGPPPTNVSIAFAGTPPTGITLGSTASLTANVSNDSTNAGVDWAVTCANQSAFGCGSLSAQHTAGGQAVTFTPPSAFAGNSDSCQYCCLRNSQSFSECPGSNHHYRIRQCVAGQLCLSGQGKRLPPFPRNNILYQLAGGGLSRRER